MEYRLEFEEEWATLNTPDMKLNITGLYPDAEYLVRVRAENTPPGLGEPSQNARFKTLPGGKLEMEGGGR